MVKPLRGLMLAVGVAILPVTAEADCPPEGSIDRYAQTARDALSALDGLVPESQQRSLESRYSAMLILKWSWQGNAAVTSDPSAIPHLAECIGSGPCAASAGDRFAAEVTDIPNAPSASLLEWAKIELACELPPEQADLETTETDEPVEADETAEPETEPVELAEAVTAAPEADDASPSVSETPATEPVEVETVEIEPAEPDAVEIAEIETTPEETVIEATEDQVPVIELADVTPAAPTVQTDTLAAATEVKTMMDRAATLFAFGQPADAIVPLREACLIEIDTGPQSLACDMLMDVFDVAIERDLGDANTPNYVALSEDFCDLGYSRGCLNLAEHFAGQDSPEAKFASLDFAARACGLGDGEACATVSAHYLTGRVTDPDPELAREKLEQSCQLGWLSSCQDVADFYLRGVGGDPDVETALELNLASCPAQGAERPDMCVAAADFALIHMQPGTERSAQVREFTQRACALGHDVGCAWYAEDLELGLGGQVDLAAAKEARLTACEYGHAESCKSNS